MTTDNPYLTTEVTEDPTRPAAAAPKRMEKKIAERNMGRPT